MQEVLTANDHEGVERFLRVREWLDPDVRVAAVERAGEGNMNLVLRVRLENAQRDSVILKQARPWVEKYPEIAAPVERMEVEVDFYRLAGADPFLARQMAGLLAADAQQHAALFTDLGRGSDYTTLYGDSDLPEAEAEALLAWLSSLHHLDVNPAAWPTLANRAMRALNRTHIFDLPLAGSGAPDADAFCPGLGRVAARLRNDDAMTRRMQELARLYEADGDRLLHGDFYPGSWLATEAGPAVIDPEFGFIGAPEFDLGVFRAHLHFSGQDPELTRSYQPPPGFDARLATAFAGAELIRRLLGVAQLPLAADLAQREAWLDLGRELLLA